MSWSWSIPIAITPSRTLWSPVMAPDRTRVVIPTFRDWDDARLTLESLMECRPGPAEIVLVNDNHDPDPPKWLKKYAVRVISYGGNRGPAHARNVGARLNTGRPVDWLYFTDSGCIRRHDFFLVLFEASMKLPRTTVAIAGPVLGTATSIIASPINFYMTEEAILNPPMDEDGPQAIVTANAAVSTAAFDAVGGFDTSYPFAAGEDLDLGIRLRMLGSIGWARHAQVFHRFTESIGDFQRRFVRYGAGNAHLECRLLLPSMKLSRVVARKPQLQPLADLQVVAMLEGYERHKRTLGESLMHPRSE